MSWLLPFSVYFDEVTGEPQAGGLMAVLCSKAQLFRFYNEQNIPCWLFW